MLFTKTPAGYEFRWPDGSDYIEVYHPKASYNDIPVVAIYAGDVKRNESELRKLVNADKSFERAYNA